MDVLVGRAVCGVVKTTVAPMTNVSAPTALPGAHLALDGKLKI